MNKLIKCALDMLKIKHNEHDLQNLNYLFRSFMIINEDYFLENHFIDICSDIEKWYNEFENVFKDYKNIESNNLEKLSKTGNSIINRLENNIEILIKYLEDENSNN